MFEIPKQEYTAESKEKAVKRVTEVVSIGRVAEDRRLAGQTLRNLGEGRQTGRHNRSGAKGHRLKARWRTTS